MASGQDFYGREMASARRSNASFTGIGPPLLRRIARTGAADTG